MLEKMLPMLIKSLGIEPQSLLDNLASFQQGVANKIAEFDARIRDMETQAAQVDHRLGQLTERIDFLSVKLDRVIAYEAKIDQILFRMEHGHDRNDERLNGFSSGD